MKLASAFLLVVICLLLSIGTWSCRESGNNDHSISLDSLNNVLLSSADGFVTINSPELSDIDEVGFCWNVTGTPTVEDEIFVWGKPFSNKLNTTIKGFEPDQSYFVRAFARGAGFLVYSEEKNLKTWNGKAQDVEGRMYKGVQVGNQGWIGENLRTTKYADGSPININNGSNRTYWYGSGHTYVPNFDTDINGDGLLDATDSLLYVEKFGLLYSWYAANNVYDPIKNPALAGKKIRAEVRDVCPAGWHIPTAEEWQELQNWLQIEHKTSDVAVFLTSKTGWAENLNGFDTYGFGLLPGGYWHTPDASHSNLIGRAAFLWLATEDNDANARYVQGDNLDQRFITGTVGKAIHGFCIRCIKDK